MNRDEMVRIRTSRRERQALLALAKQEGMGQCEMARALIRDRAKAAGIWNELGAFDQSDAASAR